MECQQTLLCQLLFRRMVITNGGTMSQGQSRKPQVQMVPGIQIFQDQSKAQLVHLASRQSCDSQRLWGFVARIRNDAYSFCAMRTPFHYPFVSKWENITEEPQSYR